MARMMSDVYFSFNSEAAGPKFFTTTGPNCRVPLEDLLAAVEQAASRYFLTVHNTSSAREGWPTGKRRYLRMQLHPCFASSLRLAKVTFSQEPHHAKFQKHAVSAMVLEDIRPASPRVLVSVASADCWTLPWSHDRLTMLGRCRRVFQVDFQSCSWFLEKWMRFVAFPDGVHLGADERHGLWCVRCIRCNFFEETNWS